MKCPFCNHEMEAGLLTPSRDGASMHWIRASYEKMYPFPPYTKKGLEEAGAVKIYTGFGLNRKADPFWLCRSCGKLIGELSDDTTK